MRQKSRVGLELSIAVCSPEQSGVNGIASETTKVWQLPNLSFTGSETLKAACVGWPPEPHRAYPSGKSRSVLTGLNQAVLEHEHLAHKVLKSYEWVKSAL